MARTRSSPLLNSLLFPAIAGRECLTAERAGAGIDPRAALSHLGLALPRRLSRFVSELPVVRGVGRLGPVCGRDSSLGRRRGAVVLDARPPRLGELVLDRLCQRVARVLAQCGGKAFDRSAVPDRGAGGYAISPQLH